MRIEAYVLLFNNTVVQVYKRAHYFATRIAATACATSAAARAA